MQVHLAVDEEQPLLGRKAEGRTFTTGRVAGAIATVCGVVGLAALKRTSSGAPLLGAAKSADPFNDVLQRQSSQFEELAASRQEGIKMMAELQVFAFVHPEGMSSLGASEYQSCVAPNSAPKNGYEKTDVEAIREDLVFATDLFTKERNMAVPVTDFANSKAAVDGVQCKAPPAIKFSETKTCVEDRGFCDNNCYMPVPENCAEGKKNFGSCSPTVGSVCESIADVSDGCNAISEEINAERARYTAMDPGSSPCADAPGTPMTVASQKQADYQTALNMWAGAVNDATEVCTVGHGLLVHNAGMYDRHYSVMKEITADLEELCAQSDGANKFDFDGAVADAKKNYIPTVRRRKLVWWQQLCEPTLASLEEITDSLEIASPQLQCFAETCTAKKATEANAFKALEVAHNEYVAAYNAYTDQADAFNGYVDQKEAQKESVIAKLESFQAGKQANSKIYARDKASFDRFDSGADAGHCGLTSCQVKTVCHAHIKDYFASFINPDTCQAVPMAVDQVCKGTTRVEDADAAKAAAEKAAAEKAAAEQAAAEAEAAANASPLEKCKAACGAKNMMCNDDISVSSHRELSCLQACHAVTVAGINEETCMGKCNTRGPSFRIGDFTYPAGRSCADRYDAGIAPRRQDNCEAGCAAGAQIAAASPAPAAPQITRTRVGEFVGDNVQALKNAINNCRGRFGTDPNCDINTWDVSKMTSFRWLFMGNTWFNENIGDWDVSNVRNFAQTFHSVTFSRCEISKWNVHAEGTLTHMFWGARNFNCDLNGWDVSKVNDFIQIFWNCPITKENTATWYDQTPVFAQTCKTYAPGGCPGNLNGRYGR